MLAMFGAGGMCQQLVVALSFCSSATLSKRHAAAAAPRAANMFTRLLWFGRGECIAWGKCYHYC